MIITVARAFFKKGYQEAVSYRMAFATRLFGATLTLAAFYFLASFVDSNRLPMLSPYGGRYLTFGLVGMIMLNLQHTSVSAYPQSIRQAQIAGTLEAMLATPTPGWLVLICFPIYRFVSAFLWAVIYLAIGGLFFDVTFDRVNILSVCLILPLCLLAFASVGFLGAAGTMILRRSNPLSLAIGGLSTLMGGVLYPTGVLPNWLQVVGKALPITHALELTRRATFVDASVTELAPWLFGLLVFCAISAPAGLLSFGWTIKRARRDGSLTHY